MNKDIKIIAFYLPQFHELEINNKWWGKGFTEWVNVKKARPLFIGHRQPRIPLDNNYYDLSNIKTMEWQANIAKKYGIYGFCYYHYWFANQPYLEKPLLNYLNHKEIDFPFCLCWANESWTNGWAGGDIRIILEQDYGNREDWKKHFEFLLPFFKDDRYIKENNSPLLVIYRPYLFKNMINMLEEWKKLAIENGFSGLKIASQRYESPNSSIDIYNYMDYHIEYQPNFEPKKSAFFKLKRKVHNFLLKKINIDFHVKKVFGNHGPKLFEYDEIWRMIIESKPTSDKAIAGGWTDWDNTPRYGTRGQVCLGVSPEKFGDFMLKQFQHIKKDYNNSYMFFFAWNEWGEGGYLEPDEEFGYGFLEALKKSLEMY